MSKAVLKWALSVSALLVTLLLSLILYRVFVNPSDETTTRPPTFLTTSSPEETYTVYLTGQKERPLFYAEVRFDVWRKGQSFLQSIYLHSGDAMDLSFEVGYPNHRWVYENTIHFYREQNFNDGKPDTLIVINKTDQVIKYLKVSSVDKFLLFDLQRGVEMKLSNSRPRGDNKWLEVVGEFYDGRKIQGTATLTPPKNSNGPFTYYIYINGNSATFEGPQLKSPNETE